MARRANGEGTIYKRTDGKWIAEATVGRLKSGAPRRVRRVCRSQADARAALKALQEDSTARDPSTLTVSAFLTSWLQDVIAPHRSPNTLDSYTTAIETHISPSIGGVKLQRLTSHQVQRMFADLLRRGIGERTRQNAYVVINVAMKHASKMGLIAANPVTAVEKPKHERASQDPFTPDEVSQILAQPGPYSALFALAFFTGCRQGELFALKWSLVNLVTGRIDIDAQATEVKGKIIVGPPKTKAGRRTIDLPAKCAEILREHRRQSLLIGHAGNPLVFPSPEGHYLRRSGVRLRYWAPLLRRLGLRHRGLHQARHTYASLALSAGVPVHVVSAILGHASPVTTMGIYAKSLPSQQIAAATVVNNLFG